jgi:ABC-type transport system involved in multi-copper enzyme maturation permease subunit
VPIDIASYRRWEGRARPTPFASLGIAATMIRRRMKFKMVRIIVYAFTLLATGLATLIFYFHLEGRGNPAIQHQIQQLGFENVNLLAVLNRLFDTAIGFWAFLLAALVGAPVIAEDRRARALPLYFSRPIGHLDYVLGKAMSAAYFLALLLILPRVSMYVMEVAFSDAEGTAWRQMPTLLRSCAAGALGVALLTSLSLGVSSMTERPTYAALFLLGLGVLTTGIAHFLAEVLDNRGWLAFSAYACVRRIGLDLLPVPISLSEDTAYLEGLPVRTAWFGLGAWIALGIGTLVARIRRVEVVT